MNIKIQKTGYLLTTICLLTSLMIRLFNVNDTVADLLLVIGGILLTTVSIMRLIYNQKKKKG